MKAENGILRSFGFNLLKFVIFMAMVAVVAIGCGSDGGGGGGGSGNSSDGGTEPVLKEGTFIDSVVEGMEYETDTQSGVTDGEGTFTYYEGEIVTFFIGDVVLGEAMAKPTMTPIDLVDEAVDETHPTVVNICRFLQSLDVDGNIDDSINISAEIRDALKGQPPVDFNQTIEDFTNDPDVQALFDTLNALNVFDTGDRELCDAPLAADHFRNSLRHTKNIIVKSPNGRELLVAGGSFEITWDASSSIDNVTILVSQDSGRNYTTPIVLSTPNDGSYTWELIPSNLAGSDNRIKIVNTDNTSCYDHSNRDFTILRELENPIGVLTPNGGERWIAGTSREIVWSAMPIIANVKIELSLDAGENYTYLIAESTRNDSVFIWISIPVAVVGEFNRIRISDADDETVFAESAASFTIESPKVHVETPDGGEQWEAGANGEIIWEASPSIENVKILLSQDGGETWNDSPVVESTPNDGSYTWTSIPPSAEGSSNRIRIMDASPTEVYDDSDSDFSVLAVSEILIEIKSANGGESWAAGTSQEIIWEAVSTIENVKIELSLDAGETYSRVIADSTPNDGVFIWDSILAEDVGSFNRIRISDADPTNSTAFDVSDASFAIFEPSIISEPSITVLTPNGGESWIAGTAYEITWDAISSIVNVRIELSLDAGENYSRVIADTTLNDGVFIWDTILAGDVGSFNRIRISDVSHLTVYDVSDGGFTIAAQEQPQPEGLSIQVVSPNVGETLQAGGSYEINWVASDSITTVKIELSTNAGENYTTIASGEANDGAYIWQLNPQEALSNFCRIRISDASDLGTFDVSDASFAIRRCITLACLWEKAVASAADDSDSDMLPDDVEVMLGTDPNDRDTDQDGLSDFDELFGNWSGSDYDRIPDLDNDGVIAALDGDDNGDGVDDRDQVDTDGDGIPNYLEYNGYTYDWVSDTYALWDGISTDVPYFKTDPLQPSTDQDPYSDAAEVSGNLMDVLISSPGDLPMVPAAPNIVVRLEGYDIALNGEITYAEGASLAKDSSWSRDTSREHSQQWDVHGEHTSTIKLGKESGYEGSLTVGGGYQGTNTTSYSTSVGQSIIHESNWQKATSVTPTIAARIKLKLKVYNYGTAAASNVLPTLTMKIGGMNVLTFKPANPINIIVPGGVYPPQQGTYWVVDKMEDMDTEPYLHLTMEELRALETGAPLSIAVTQMESDVMLLDSDGQWESAGNWGEYMARCEAVSSNIFLDTGDGRFIHHMVYADDLVTSPEVTFWDALNWIAGVHTEAGQPYITYYDPFEMQEVVMPLAGFHFIVDNETLTNNGWDTSNDPPTHPSGAAFNINDMVLGPRSVVIGKVSPDVVNQTVPKIHYAYYDEQLDRAVVLASDYIGVSGVVLQTGSGDFPMDEAITGAGYYQLDGVQDGCCDSSCTALATNTNGQTVEEAVECLAYPEIVSDKPQILAVSVKSAADGNVFVDVQVQGTEEWPVAKVWVYDPANPTVEIQLDRDLNYWSNTDRYFKKIDGMPYSQLSEMVIVAECDRDTCPITDPNCYATYKVSPGDLDVDSLDNGEGSLINRYEDWAIIDWKALYSYLDFYESPDPAGGSVKFAHYGQAWTGSRDLDSTDNVIPAHGEAEVFMAGKGFCDFWKKKHQTIFLINANWRYLEEDSGDTVTKESRMKAYDFYDAAWISDYLNANDWPLLPYSQDPTQINFPPDAMPKSDSDKCEVYEENQFEIVLFEIPNTTYVVKFMFYDYELGHSVNWSNGVKYMYDVYDIGN